MSIVVYTGKPGSGKTYRVVKELLQDEGRYYVLHNIDGLKEALIEGGRYIQNWTNIENFFTKEKQGEISTWARSEHNRSVLVIVDEAQTWFGDRNPKIKAWLSWHRHLGQDIKLICQHWKMLNQDFYNLVDYEIRGKRGYLTSKMVYQWSVNGESFKTDRLAVNKAVFAAYTSFVGGEVNKGRSKMLLYAAGACVFAVVMGVYVIGFGLPSVFAKAGGDRKATLNRENKSGGVKNTAKEKVNVKKVDPILEKAMTLSYAGVVGGKVLVQDTRDLALYPLSDVMDYQVVKYDGRGVLVMSKERGLMKINVRNSRYLAASKIKDSPRAAEPPSLARGRGDGS